MFDIAVLFKLGVTAAVARDEVRNLWILASEKCVALHPLSLQVAT